MRGVVWVVILVLAIGIVLAAPPNPPAEPTLSPDNCSWAPTTEVCDGIDNDCDGDIDEGVCSTGGSVDDNADEGDDSPSSSPSSSPRSSPSSSPSSTANPLDESDDVVVNNTSTPPPNPNVTKKERKEAETKQILEEMNLTDVPKINEEPGKAVTFWTKKAFIYGGAGLFLTILLIIGIVYHVERNRRKGIQKQEHHVRAWHDVLRNIGKEKRERSPEEKAQEYVAHMRAKGYADKIIKDHLRQAGWTEEQIAELIPATQTVSAPMTGKTV